MKPLFLWKSHDFSSRMVRFKCNKHSTSKMCLSLVQTQSLIPPNAWCTHQDGEAVILPFAWIQFLDTVSLLVYWGKIKVVKNYARDIFLIRIAEGKKKIV